MHESELRNREALLLAQLEESRGREKILLQELEEINNWRRQADMRLENIEKTLQAPKPPPKDIKFGGYDWRVLEMQDTKALLLSDKVLERRWYHDCFANVTWENCDLRRYLNGPFFDSFTAEEKKLIIPAQITNNNNPWFKTKGGKTTTDRIFLLSIGEVIKFFGDSGQLRCKNLKTEYYYIDDEYNSARIAVDIDNEVSWWWLRSPGYDSHDAARVGNIGRIRVRGLAVFLSGIGGGVRPALWLNL